MPHAAHLGVDFGTSHTVAVLRYDDGVTIPLLFDGSPQLPSAVYADSGGTLSTGRDAVHSARIDPSRFEPHPKRRVDDGTVLLGDVEFTVPQLFAAVLSRVRDECVNVSGLVPPSTLTHPAAWGPARRLVLDDAATQAGFADYRLLPEPVAAATWFTRPGCDTVRVGSCVVVYDFGGGTFDVSVVARTATGFEPMAVDGSPELGGVDLDHLLMRHVGAVFADDPSWGRLASPRTPKERRHLRTLIDDIRIAKERLSRHTQVDLLVPLLDKQIHLTRDELESVARPLLDKAVRLTQAVIRASRLTPDRTAGVFLVGGASRMPLVATLLHQATGLPPVVIDQPELVVAQGATMPAPVARVPSSPPEPVSPAVVGKPPNPPRPERMTAARPAWAWTVRILVWIQVAMLAFAVTATGLVMLPEDPPDPVLAPWWMFLMATATTAVGAVAWERTHRRLLLGAEYLLPCYGLVLGLIMSDAPTFDTYGDELGAFAGMGSVVLMPSVVVVVLLHLPRARIWCRRAAS